MVDKWAELKRMYAAEEAYAAVQEGEPTEEECAAFGAAMERFHRLVEQGEEDEDEPPRRAESEQK
jgi:hypothetical protein